MYLNSYLISVYSSSTRRSKSTMSGSAVKSGFMTSLSTSFKAPGLYRMLIYVKARVSLSSEISLSRKASYTLNLISSSR